MRRSNLAHLLVILVININTHHINSAELEENKSNRMTIAREDKF